MLNYQLEDQVAFVAGSSRGIGRAIAEGLLQQGARVVLTGRDNESLRKACEEIGQGTPRERLHAICGDFADPTVIASGVASTIARFGRIDHLVANLGTGSGESGWSPAEEKWQASFDHNFFASMRLAQAVIPHLIENQVGGTLLFISSIVGMETSAAPLPYSAAKAALMNYSKNLARQLGPVKVRVNTIAPGNIWFPDGSWQRKLDKAPDEVQRMLLTEVPLQRFGTVEEVASLAVYLCSPQAGFSTGGCYVVDGGQTRGI